MNREEELAALIADQDRDLKRGHRVHRHSKETSLAIQGEGDFTLLDLVDTEGVLVRSNKRGNRRRYGNFRRRMSPHWAFRKMAARRRESKRELGYVPVELGGYDLWGGNLEVPKPGYCWGRLHLTLAPHASLSRCRCSFRASVKIGHLEYCRGHAKKYIAALEELA